MNPVTKGGGDMISTNARASFSAMLNGARSANTPTQHDPQLLQVAFL